MRITILAACLLILSSTVRAEIKKGSVPGAKITPLPAAAVPNGASNIKVEGVQPDAALATSPTAAGKAAPVAAKQELAGSAAAPETGAVFDGDLRPQMDARSHVRGNPQAAN